MYSPLWVKSSYSFLIGASHPEELVQRAHRLGLPALALTDRDGVYGVVQAHLAAKELGVHLVIGAEVTVKMGTTSSRLVLLASSRKGYALLCRLISVGRLRASKGQAWVTLDEVCRHSQDLIALGGDATLLPLVADAFYGRLYALCARHLHARDRFVEEGLRQAAARIGAPVVAATEVLYHAANRRMLHDVLTCIRHGTTLAQAGTLLNVNSEHDLKSAHAMQTLYADLPGALTRTLDIAERCTFSLDELRYRYPAERRPDGVSAADWLRELTLAGARTRYGEAIPAPVRAQIERELTLIHELDYGGYFLTMYEIVQFCRRQNILCQGRGSAANSAVCYCLGITAVDPIKLDLLFERFLSRERAEPPDIDLDIEHARREEVIQWVYERYGRTHAAMVAVVVRYRTKSAVREVGKTLGLPLATLDHLAKLLDSRFVALDQAALAHAGLDPGSPAAQHLVSLVQEIRDFPRHLSIHPGGFLLGNEPIDTLVPIEPATMEGRTVIQWDKYACEDLGLFKVDLLGLGALTQIHQCFDLVAAHQGRTLSLATLPHEDAATYEMIDRADTVGVFQIESRAQMSMLPRLRPRTFYDLVIEVAIVRPGPIQGDMVHPYLQRRTGEEKPHYPHPALERVLAKTLGVPIFQEQVMKIAVLVGGYTPGEADRLRRDMAAWKSSGRIERHHDKLVGRMIENGITPTYAERIFSQIRGFGEYGFPESHAASFALIAYATAYLRCHHPAAFVCSLLNAQPMGFYSPATLVEDAKRQGVEVRPIDVQKSGWDCQIESGAVRMGLRYVKGLGERDHLAFAQAPPPYRDLDDLARRTGLRAKSLTALAEAGALESLRLGRRDALWAVRELTHRAQDALPLGGPHASHRFADLGRGQEVLWDYRLSHHSTRGHPMLTWRETLSERGMPTATQVTTMPDGTRTDYVGLVICRQQPGTATGVTFYTLEDETGFVNLVVWQRVFQKYSLIARTAVLMGVAGKVQAEHGVVHLVADRLWVPDRFFAAPGATVRSFH